MESLFGGELAELKPEFFTSLEDCKKKTENLSKQYSEIAHELDVRKRMVYDTKDAICTLNSNHQMLVEKQHQARMMYNQACESYAKKIRGLEVEELPSELRLQLSAANKLSQHVKSILVRTGTFRQLIQSRLSFNPSECSICCQEDKQLFILNCGHGPFCEACILKFNNVCSNCRQTILSKKSVSAAIFDAKFFPHL
jgi:hypothetical protein